MNEKEEITGRVVKQAFGTGSKSEHDAIYLDTGDKKYRLKLKGGNPFFDERLNQLVGKKITAKGNVSTHFFEISGNDYSVVEG